VRFRLIPLMLLFFVPLTAADLYSDWVVITAQNEAWPMLTLPSLKLGDEFQFDPEKNQLPVSFEIMRTEVSCAQLLAGKQLLPIRQQQLGDVCEYAEHEPVTGVSFNEASAYCAMLGGQLPSEAQWVLAASLGSERWLQHYGVITTAGAASEPIRFTAYKQDVADAEISPGQLNGILANVWEITRSNWPGQRNVYVMKGGAFDLTTKPQLLHPYFRAAFNGNDIYNKNIGFRCVRATR
jgi:formylglycine-generating enzyme required for sulfatase activity